MTASVARVRPPLPFNRMATASRGSPLHRMPVILRRTQRAARRFASSFGLHIDRSRQRRAARTDERADRFNRRKPGGAARAPVRTCPCGSGSRAGKCRPGADDRQPAGSASHRARRDGLSRHAGPLQARCSNGDVPNHCDRGLRAAACDDRSFFYPVCCLMLVPATGRCRCSGDQSTTFRARRDAAAAPRPTAASPRTAFWPVRKAFAAGPENLASSTLARLSSQGPGQRGASPAGQGGGRAGWRPERAWHAGSYETETSAQRRAPAPRRQGLAE